MVLFGILRKVKRQGSFETDKLQWFFATNVPGYSGGTVTELHRFPYSPS